MSQHFKGLRLRPKYQPSSQQESSRTMSSWSALYVDDLSTASVAVCGTYLEAGAATVAEIAALTSAHPLRSILHVRSASASVARRAA